MLRKKGEQSIHAKNLPKIMTEVYTCLNESSPSFLLDIFKRNQAKYNLRVKDLVHLPDTRTFRYGNDSLSSRGRSSICHKRCQQHKTVYENHKTSDGFAVYLLSISDDFFLFYPFRFLVYCLN